jgi:hypothetical protein
MGSGYFFEATMVEQDYAHCGAASLALCLSLMGRETDQYEVARSAGKPRRIYEEGLDEDDLLRAVQRLGAAGRIVESTAADGTWFLEQLDRQLARGLPVILCVDDFSHWVAVVAGSWQSRRYVVWDPIELTIFDAYSPAQFLERAWCRWGEDDDPEAEEDKYFALFLSWPEGRPARWVWTPGFQQLCRDGAEDSAESMRDDLLAMVATSGGSRGAAGGTPLTEVLERCVPSITAALQTWHAYSDATLPWFLGTYRTVAEAARLTVGPGLDEGRFAVELTALASVYSLYGEV